MGHSRINYFKIKVFWAYKTLIKPIITKGDKPMVIIDSKIILCFCKAKYFTALVLAKGLIKST
jgi:hypothetical protein